MRRVAELLLADDDPAKEPVGGVLRRERDPAEYLHRAVRDLACSARHVGLGDRRGLGGFIGALIERRGRVQHGRPSARGAHVHVGEDVAQRLEAADAVAELPALARVPPRLVEDPLSGADRLRGSEQRAGGAQPLERLRGRRLR